MKTILVVLFIFLASGTLLFAGGRNETAVQEPAAAAFSDERLSSEKLAEIIASGDPNTYLVDVRTEEEYKSGAIPSAINIPFDVIADNLPTQDRSARIIVYCRSGNRSGIAYETLAELGYANVLDFGGVSNWRGELEVRQ
ncbi:MAG: rhodanese-like domain-containing protein [Spirochaetaceae bacterium]|nr:MAG: rhodanese-like domain-containing protein [Spirochaetaceae bacterium]